MQPRPPERPLTDPALRAALLALGLGLLWAALSRTRRRRPTDLW